MIEIKLHGTYNIYYAILGMRNPMNSWHLMDSRELDQAGNCKIGEKDLNLAQRLILEGSEHGKFLRFITVCFDLTAPLYWWKEFDTYKFAEKNSCSTMHKLTSKDLGAHDFSFDKLTDFRNAQIRHLNDLIKAYKSREGENEEDNEFRKIVFIELIQDLPSAYMQKRTVITNYAELRNIYFQRRNHKLDEWRKFCTWVEETLLYAKELICLEKSEIKN